MGRGGGLTRVCVWLGVGGFIYTGVKMDKAGDFSDRAKIRALLQIHFCFPTILEGFRYCDFGLPLIL